MRLQQEIENNKTQKEICTNEKKSADQNYFK
jgi:hypothetical protein